MAGGFSILPLTLVNILISVCNSSFTVEELVLDLALVEGAIRELDLTDALPVGAVLGPLTSVLPILINLLIVIVPNKILVFWSGHELVEFLLVHHPVLRLLWKWILVGWLW